MGQPTLFDDSQTPEAAAFEDGTLSIMEKGHDRYDSRVWGGHVRAGAFLAYAGPFATIHVISRHAGGEIRGYVRINGTLYRRTPSYPTEWPDLDAVVSVRLGCQVVADEQESSAAPLMGAGGGRDGQGAVRVLAPAGERKPCD